jgi:hypothetical protein
MSEEADWRQRAETAEARVVELAEERARLWDDNVKLRAQLREAEHQEQQRRGRLTRQLKTPLRLTRRAVKRALGG